MVLDNATVTLTHGKSVEGRVLFKESGYIGVNTGDGWTYYPQHRVQEIESHA
ncbi:MAG TPA: hypothetical protein VKP88_03105 [Candidatus Paceibacterota bacterium]|nr:hypothetical protein [Candidatus Paceibacterota bacterium]